MLAIRKLTAISLCASLITFAASQGNSFDRIRYNGGSISNSVDPKDWGTHLTVYSDKIIFRFKNGQEITINPKTVTTLSYGQEAHRRVGTMIALAILVSPVALFGLLHKTRLHFIGMEWTTDGKKDGMLLQGDKDNYRAILVALQSVTGVPVSVAESEHGFIPAGVTTTTVKNSEPPQHAEANQSNGSNSDAAPGTVNVVSIPDAAEIYVADEFMGDTPATLKLKPGKHAIRIKQTGYQDWVREMTVSSGTVSLSATLVAGSSTPVPEPAATRPAQSQIAPSQSNYPTHVEIQHSPDSNSNAGWVGITTQDDATKGIIITRVVPGSSAANAGLEVGDIIVELNGKPVTSGMQFDVAIAHSPLGSEVRIGYLRGAWKFEVKVMVGKIV